MVEEKVTKDTKDHYVHEDLFIKAINFISLPLINWYWIYVK